MGQTNRSGLGEQTPMEVSPEEDGYRLRWEADATYDPGSAEERLRDQDFGAADAVDGEDGFTYLRHESGEVEAYLEQDGVEFVYHGEDEPNKYVQLGLASLLTGDNIGFDVSTWLDYEEDEDLPYDLIDDPHVLDPAEVENQGYGTLDGGIID